MTMTSMKAKIVRVRIEEGKTGLFYATCPDLRGLLVAEPNLDELDKAIPKSIVDLFAASDLHVVVTKAEDGEDDLTPWVAVPAVVAKAAMEAAH